MSDRATEIARQIAAEYECGGIRRAGIVNAIAEAIEAEQARTVKVIAEVAEAVGWQANVGGMETAGMIVSALAAKPDEMTWRFLKDRTELMLSGEISVEKGCLTFHRKLDGKVTTPQQLRVAIEVKRMERAANQ